jgi:signal recognition particle subunit SRP19
LKLHGKVVVWPANLDSSKSRKEGRKLAKGLAIQAPRLEELHEAARRLAMEAEPTPGKSRPGIWWERGGYLTFPKKDSRTSLLRSLAGEVKRIRAAKVGHEKERK